MPSYTLEIEAFGVFATNAPSLEIWEDGVLDSTHSISATGTSILVTINYPGTIPTSLALTFNDGFAAAGRTIEIQSVKINDKYVNIGNYLSDDSLTKGQSANVDIANSDFFYDSSEPAASVFTPVTLVLTAALDNYRNFDGADYILDGLTGNDRIWLGAGNDIVTGGAGNDWLRGGAGNDLLYGAADHDRIFGEDGDDLIYGGTGNDTIHGGADNDEIHGNDGNDKLHGNAGDDVITGGAGNDVITGGAGTNFLFGDAGDDQIIGDSGVDTIDGGDDDDILYGGGGDDIIEGGDGNDILVGDDGDDRLDGNDGNDLLYGRDDDDELNGGAGNDTLYGGNDNDTLNGGDNDDFLHGEDGSDTLNGGDGNDAIYGDIGAINFSSGLLVLEAEDYETKIDRGGKSLSTVSDATASGGQVVVAGPNTGTILASTGIEDTAAELTYTVNFTSTGTFYVWIKAGVASGGSNDSVHLGFDGIQQTGNGGIQTGSNYGWHNTETGTGTVVTVNVTTTGAHTLNLWMREDGSPIDKIIIADTPGFTPTGIGPDAGTRTSTSGGVDIISGGDGDDRLYGDIGNDTLNGDADNDILHGGDGDDTLNGGTGDDKLYGGIGDDTLNGGDDNDTLYGADGIDTLNGDAGDDIIYSGSVTNTLTTILSSTAEANHIGGGWIVQTYTTVGTVSWTPHADVSDVYYLVVGGGGGGGGRHGGGGGAGGLVTNWGGTALSVTATPYTITVGDGGSFTQTSPTNQSIGENGEDSVFGAITALGGGGGGSYTANNSDAGGSGGGGGGVGPTTGGSGDGRDENRDAGIGAQTDSGGGTGYGNNGGDGAGPGATASNTGGGGGGGAGTAGSNGSGQNGGDGGDGLLYDITGQDIYYAGGGGGGGQSSGGSGGLGGGGNGSNNTPTDGTDGLGGGGGGARSNTTSATGADGGSGTVIIRYQVATGEYTTLAGGTGNDTLYGAAGLDVFEFSHRGAGNLDTINNFTLGADQLDLSDLLTGYDPLTDAITDFVSITDSGGNSDVRVDTGGGGSFGGGSVVATIIGVTGMTDEAALEANGTLII